MAAIAIPRPYSITVFGCTGNAGRGVAYHVVKSAILGHGASANNSARMTTTKRPMRVALAGRSRDKVNKIYESIIEQLRQEGILKDDYSLLLCNDDENTKLVDIVIADVTHEQSMQNLASSTHILISCTGPYGRYGESSVKACVENFTHYVDITGEVDFIEEMIHKYGSQAETNGVTLCPFSGYDCVPSELGMWLVGKALENYGDESATLGKLELNVRATGGGLPRGTILTLLDGADKQKQKHTTRKEEQGEELVDRGSRFYPKKYRPIAKAALSPYHFLLPKYQMGQFTGPNFMSIVNVPVLCRAAPTLGFTHEDLSISDRLSVVGRGSWYNGYYGLVQAQIYILALVAGGMFLTIPKFRSFLRERLDVYNFHGDPSGKVYVDVKGAPSSSSSQGGIVGRKTAYALARCIYPGDPGIYATGFFATGVANALLEATTTTGNLTNDGESFSSENNKHIKPLAGFHSPVAALHGCRPGLLVDHLREMGAQIKVEIVPKEGVAGREIDTTKLRSKL